MKLIQAFALAVPEAEFDPSDYHSNWSATPFIEDGPIGDGPIEDGNAERRVNIEAGLEVLIAFDYHSRSATTDDSAVAAESVADDALKSDDDSTNGPPEGLHLVGTFLLEYTIQEPDNHQKPLDEPIAVEAADIVAFANFNATFNAWPYWREFVQSMTGRMGLPGVIIPVLPVPNLSSPPRQGTGSRSR